MIKNALSPLVGLILLITLVIACQPKHLNLDNYLKQGDKVLIAINDTTPVLTNRQLFEHLWGSESWLNGVVLDTNAVSKIVDSILMDTVVGMVADADIKLSDYFPQYWGCQEQYKDIILGQYYKKYIFSQIDIDTTMVREYRDKHVDKYTIPGQVFFYHILISPKYYALGPNALDYKYKTPEELVTIQEEFALELYEAISNGEDFEAIAREFSHDKLTMREGGLVGWSSKGSFHDPFDSIAFSAELNVTQPPFHDGEGWHIIKVVDKIETGPLPLDRQDMFATVYGDLRSELSGAIIKKVMDSLYQDVSIEYNEDVLDRNVFRSDEDVIAAVVNKIDTIYFMNIRNLELDYRQAYGVRNTTPEIKKTIIARLAGRSRVYMAALEEQMDTLPAIVDVKYAIYHNAARTLVIGSRFDPTYRPAEVDIEAYYEAHKDEYVIAQPIKIQTLLVIDSTLADFLSDQANSGYDFDQLEKDYLGKTSGQDLSIKPVGPEDVSEEMWLLLHQIPVNSSSRPIKVDSLWTITKLIERKISITIAHAHGEIISILSKKFISDEIAEFTRRNSLRFGITRKNKLSPIMLKPLRNRYEMVL